MTKIQLTLCRRFHLPLALLLMGTIILGTFSCGEDTERKDLDGNCVILTKKQIQNAWVEPGYISQFDSLKFYTGYMGPGTDFIVMAYGMKADGNIIDDSGVQMSTGTNCLATLPQDILMGPNQFKFSVLDIWDAATGRLKAFNYIKLMPIEEPADRMYMAFDVYVVNSSGVSTRVGKSDPCPPLCPQ